MINIYLDPKQKEEKEEEICSICHDNLDDNKYEIPECHHNFHSGCIIEWYRTGNIRCPYCNSTPTILDEEDDNYNGSSRRMIQNKYKIISSYCRRKTANVQIKKKVEVIQKLNDKIKEIDVEITNLKKEEGIFKEISAKLSSLGRSKWRIRHNIYQKKSDLIEMVNIIPYILKK